MPYAHPTVPRAPPVSGWIVKTIQLNATPAKVTPLFRCHPAPLNDVSPTVPPCNMFEVQNLNSDEEFKGPTAR